MAKKKNRFLYLAEEENVKIRGEILILGNSQGSEYNIDRTYSNSTSSVSIHQTLVRVESVLKAISMETRVHFNNKENKAHKWMSWASSLRKEPCHTVPQLYIKGSSQ